MATPVTVTRIQNRRGTQAQFETLYPQGYQGTGGFGDPVWSTQPVLISSVVATGTTITVSIISAYLMPPYNTLLVPGSAIVVSGVTPSIYNDTYTISSIDTVTSPGFTLINCASILTGSADPDTGSFYLPFVIENYQGVLLPGEIALCTDSRRMFIGNLNGEYIDVSVSDNTGIKLPPLTLSLPPAAIPTIIPALTYSLTNFLTLLYDVTDAPPDVAPPLTHPGAIGPTFARNGEMKVTAVVSPMVPTPPVPPIPFPPVTPVNLVDTSSEINLTPLFDISFSAQYDNNISPTQIQICYQHNFPGSLIFSTSTLLWI